MWDWPLVMMSMTVICVLISLKKRVLCDEFHQYAYVTLFPCYCVTCSFLDLHSISLIICLGSACFQRIGLYAHLCSSLITYNVLICQVTNIEYDGHKGRIAIGRLHAGVLQKGMDVKVLTVCTDMSIVEKKGSVKLVFMCINLC